MILELMKFFAVVLLTIGGAIAYLFGVLDQFTSK
jgi:hypothetical protein